MLVIVILLVLPFILALFSYPLWRLTLREQARRHAEQIKREQSLLELSPSFQQKLAADRAYELATRKLNLDTRKLEIDAFKSNLIQPGVTVFGIAPDARFYTAPARLSATKEESGVESALVPDFPAMPLTTIVQALPYNQLAFSFGIYRYSGEPVTTVLPDALHTQITGASGQGKSVGAQGLIAQLAASNDPAHLEMAFLDPEGDTTIPFRGLPHVRYLADSADRAAKGLADLNKMINSRPIGKQTALLIFVEEFTALQRMMSAHLRAQALEDFTQIALRGRRRWMYLLVLGQTAYAQKDMRDAQMQFQSILTFALRPTAARAAGMGGNNEMLKTLWAERRPGQFLLQSAVASGDQLVLAPYTNERQIAQVLRYSGAVPTHFRETSDPLPVMPKLNSGKPDGKQPELDFVILARMREMLRSGNNVSQKKIIDACFPGMRAVDAQKLYWHYMAAIAERSEM